MKKNPEIKRKDIVAGMRKLLILIFVLWKKNEIYNPKHQWQSTDSENEETKSLFWSAAKAKISEAKAPP